MAVSLEIPDGNHSAASNMKLTISTDTVMDQHASSGEKMNITSVIIGDEQPSLQGLQHKHEQLRGCVFTTAR